MHKGLVRIVDPNPSNLDTARSSVAYFVEVELPLECHNGDFKLATPLLKLDDLGCELTILCADFLKLVLCFCSHFFVLQKLIVQLVDL